MNHEMNPEIQGVQIIQVTDQISVELNPKREAVKLTYAEAREKYKQKMRRNSLAPTSTLIRTVKK
jgi:hypothetical protein